MAKLYIKERDVVSAAKERLREHYRAGDRIVYSLSGGKDSTVIMELGIQVAREEGLLPVQCITRDEEIMYPGTFEYLERVLNRKEVSLRWIIAGQPIINAYNRFLPYWWVFDPVEQDKWVRQPPTWSIRTAVQCIDGMTNNVDYPPQAGKRLIAVIGLRADESLTRTNRIASTGGLLTKHPTAYGAYTLAPIYDWTDRDVWKYLKDNQFDYNMAYNQMFQIGIRMKQLRIAPPSMQQGMESLKYAIRLWPTWFDKVDKRLPGIRTAARYGRRALEPLLMPDETWEQVFERLVQDAKDRGITWLYDRMVAGRRYALVGHAAHSNTPYPQTKDRHCALCPPKNPGSWEKLAKTLYNGDPWRHYNQNLQALEPYELRVGALPWFEDGKKGGGLHW